MRRYILAAVAASCAVAAGCRSDSAGPSAGPPASVEATTRPASTGVVGSSVGSFAVKVVDAVGLAVAGAAVTFTASGGATVDPTSASTDANGMAATRVTLGTIAGATATVTASVVGLATTPLAIITTTAGALERLVVTPKAVRFLAVGDSTKIDVVGRDRYGNPVATGNVSYLSADPTLVSVGATGVAHALRLGGTTSVIASTDGRADTTIVTVVAAGASRCAGIVAPPSLAVGEVTTFSGAPNGCLSGGGAGADYLMVTFNGSTNGSRALTTSVIGNGLDSPPSLFVAPTNGPLALRSALAAGRSVQGPQLDESFHARLLARAGAALRGRLTAARSWRRTAPARASSSGFAPSAAYAAIPAGAKVGDLVSMNVSAAVCDDTSKHALRVAAVGARSIVLADTLNPKNGFSDADYQRFATRFDTLVYPLDVDAFGIPSDVDANGKIAVLFTRAVNELTPGGSTGFVGGFFNPRDLFPRVATGGLDGCPGSNEGEMFYMLVPDPEGAINGNVRTVGFVDSLTTGVLAHEFQHLINAGRRIYVNTSATDFEAVWLNEGLSHIAEELLYYRESGKAPRMNLGDSTIRLLARDTYHYWASDASQNFKRLVTYLRAPGANSPIAGDDELATRGATWSFLRYAADRLAASDGTIWKRFDDATTTGMATLQAVLGTDPVPLLRDWTVANYLDDSGFSSDPRYSHQSWNYRDIYTKTFLGVPFYPLRVTQVPDDTPISLSNRGGSASYLRLSVPAGKEALITFSSGGGLPSAPLQFVVIRTK